jgi:hypothetical protein
MPRVVDEVQGCIHVLMLSTSMTAVITTFTPKAALGTAASVSTIYRLILATFDRTITTGNGLLHATAP